MYNDDSFVPHFLKFWNSASMIAVFFTSWRAMFMVYKYSVYIHKEEILSLIFKLCFTDQKRRKFFKKAFLSWPNPVIIFILYIFYITITSVLCFFLRWVKRLARVNSFLPNVSFWSPWKHQKTYGFLMFSGGSKGNIRKEKVKAK